MKIGLVLSGGGARGAYEVGVWKALEELGITKHIKVISGTSIGALNSILFISQSIKDTEKLWKSLSREQILQINNIELKIKKFILSLGIKNLDLIKRYIPKIIIGGSISPEGILKLIDSVDLGSIKKSKITCYATCTQIPEMNTRYFKLNEYTEDEIKKILIASSAIPTIFESVDIEGYSYLDGGITLNEPIQPVYGEGCDVIIVIHLEKDKKVYRNIYPNAKIIEITPSIIENDNFDGILDFNSTIISNKISMGYKDTMDMLNPIMKLTEEIIKENTNNNKWIKNYFKKKS